MPRNRRLAAAGVTAAAISLLASACTGQSKSGATDDASKDTTITFWHGWNSPTRSRRSRTM